MYLENFSRRVQGIILFARGGGGGVFRGLFLVSLQQMHDCVLSHKTHNRRLKLKKKIIKKAAAWNSIPDQFTIYDIKMYYM